MIRKLLLPLLAVALLGGCVTSGYSHRHGNGDYYYGAPSVDYRYYAPYGSYYGGAYGYYGQPYGYYGQPYGYRYGYPYGYQPYYYGRRYPHPYYGQPRVHYPRPVQRPQVDPTPDGEVSPWRDLERLRGRDLERLRARGRGGQGVPEVMTQPTIPQVDPDLSSGRDTERRRPVRIGAPVPMPQPRMRVSPPEPPSAALGSEDSALGGSARRSPKSDPGIETAP